MGEDELKVLKAAVLLTGSQPWLIEFPRLAQQTGLDPARVSESAAIHLHSRAYCIVTFGGMQLTTAGMRAGLQA